MEENLNKCAFQIAGNAMYIRDVEKLMRCYRKRFYKYASTSGKVSWISSGRFLKFILGSINYWRVLNLKQGSSSLCYLGLGWSILNRAFSVGLLNAEEGMFTVTVGSALPFPRRTDSCSPSRTIMIPPHCGQQGQQSPVGSYCPWVSKSGPHGLFNQFTDNCNGSMDRDISKIWVAKLKVLQGSNPSCLASASWPWPDESTPSSPEFFLSRVRNHHGSLTGSCDDYIVVHMKLPPDLGPGKHSIILAVILLVFFKLGFDKTTDSHSYA